MSYTITDRTIALSGIFQATKLVQQIANTGSYDQHSFEVCIKSIFCTDAEKPEDVFNGYENLTSGISTLINQLDSNKAEEKTVNDAQITKYVIGVMILEKQLRKDTNMLQTISDGINRAKRQSDHFDVTHENVIASLADLYKNTISTLRPRIMVHGEKIYIANPNHENRIRVMLLAAIRAAVLWRQCGGTRWQLIFHRRNIINIAENIMALGSDRKH